MSSKRVVIIANGTLRNFDYHRSLFKGDDYFICINGGAVHAFNLGIKPDLVLGDLDSLQPGEREKLVRFALELIEYPSAKEKSDLELALDKAVDMKPQEIMIIGALGGKRADHFFINLLLLLVPLNRGIPARIVDEFQEIRIINEELIIEGRPGDYLSLFALTPETSGISTEGLKFPLENESLNFASTLGLSNEFVSSSARITLQSGLLLVIKCDRGPADLSHKESESSN